MPDKRPVLNVKGVVDAIIRRNFQNLKDYFTTQGQLLDFQFFTQTFTDTQVGTPIQINHSLGIVPSDIIVTLINGTGAVTFLLGQFTTTSIFLTANGPCTIRFFLGNASKDQSASFKSTDTQSFQAQIPTGGTSTTTINNTTTNTTTISPFLSGMVIMWAGPKSGIPTGWAECTGASQTTTAALYASLFAAIAYGWGGSGTSFNLPMTSGLFPRGVADGSTNDPDRAARTAINTGGNTGDNVGSFQADDIASHTHARPAVGTFVTFGSGSSTAPGGGNVNASPGASATGAGGGPLANETRGKNFNIYFIIKL